MHAQLEMLSRQLREDVKSDGRSEPRFEGEVLTGDASWGGSQHVKVYLTGGNWIRSPREGVMVGKMVGLNLGHFNTYRSRKRKNHP